MDTMIGQIRGEALGSGTASSEVRAKEEDVNEVEWFGHHKIQPWERVATPCRRRRRPHRLHIAFRSPAIWSPEIQT